MALIGNQENIYLENIGIDQLKDSGINQSNIKNDLKIYRVDFYTPTSLNFNVDGIKTDFPLSLQGDLDYDETNLLVFVGGKLQKYNVDYIFKETPTYYSITGIIINTPGGIISDVPEITISTPDGVGDTVQATAQAKVISSLLSEIVITNIGYGYTSIPSVIATPATVTAEISNTKTMIEFTTPPTENVAIYHLKYNDEGIQEPLPIESITVDKLTSNSGTSIKFKDGLITSQKIDDGVITNTKLANFLDEDDLTSNSSTGIPSQQSVKAYSDNIWDIAKIDSVNSMLNSFIISSRTDLSYYPVVDGFMDTFQDADGINETDSTSYTRTSGSSLKLLLHGDGVPNTQNFIDSSYYARDLTAVRVISGSVGDLYHSAENPKFGETSIYFSGYFTQINLSNDSNLLFYSNDNENWTIDLFVKFDGAKTKDETIWEIYITNGPRLYWDFSESRLTFNVLSSEIYGDVGLCDDEEWHHVAICKKGTTTGMYIDGILQDSFTKSYSLIQNSSLTLGAHYGTGSQNYIGWMDEFRVVKDNIFNADPTNINDTITVPITPMDVIYEDYVEPTLDSTRENMKLVSTKVVTTDVPEYVYATIIRDDMTSNNDGTNFVMFVSRDGGTNFTEIPLNVIDNYIDYSNIKYYSGIADLSDQNSDTTMMYMINSHSNIDFKLHGVGLQW